MAVRAVGSGERGAGRGVDGVIRVAPIGLVTELVSAIRGSGRQIVAARGGGVALRALDVGVCVGQREPGGRVIKRGVRPARRVVTGRALRHGETCGDVIRNIAAERLRAVPILQVAGRVAAIIRLNRQRVVVADVARGAGSGRGRDVHAGQREAGDAVVERAQVGPRDGIVALRAIRSRKSRPGRSVRRVVRLLPGGQVAASVAAIRWRDLKIVVVIDVALRASNGRVGVGQRKPCAGMVKGRGIPTRRVMAITATRQGEGLRRIGVRRIIGLLPSGKVTARVPAV